MEKTNLKLNKETLKFITPASEQELSHADGASGYDHGSAGTCFGC